MSRRPCVTPPMWRGVGFGLVAVAPFWALVAALITIALSQ
jgi:hypothetical protein